MKTFATLLILSAFWLSCKTTGSTTGKPVKGGKDSSGIAVTGSNDTTHWVFEPDAFSSLLELETRFGVMKVELFFNTVEHRENFIKLVKEGFYNDLLFHRVIRNFMIQGGDPASRNASAKARLGGGQGGKELTAQINTDFFHVKGALAAARQPDEVNPEKKSSGSQFYIVQGSGVNNDQLDRNERKYGFAYSPEQRRLYQQLGGAPQLDMEYTVFGRVYEGFEVIDSIAAQPTGDYDRPTPDIKMNWKIVRE